MYFRISREKESEEVKKKKTAIERIKSSIDCHDAIDDVYIDVMALRHDSNETMNT